MTACAIVSPRRPAQGGRVVHRVAYDRRVGGAEDRRRHLVRDGRECVRDDRAQDRVRLGHRLLRARRAPTGTCSSTSASLWPRATVQSGGTTTVVSYSSTSSGPASAPRRSPRGGRRRLEAPVCVAEVGLARRPCDCRLGCAAASGEPPRGGPTTDQPQRPDHRQASRPRGACRRGDRARPRSARSAPRRVDLAGLAGKVDGDVPVLAAVADVGERSHSTSPRPATLSVRASRISSSSRWSTARSPARASTLQKRTSWNSVRAKSRPTEENRPASGGTTAVRTPSSAASAAAWIGPAPP